MKSQPKEKRWHAAAEEGGERDKARHGMAIIMAMNRQQQKDEGGDCSGTIDAHATCKPSERGSSIVAMFGPPNHHGLLVHTQTQTQQSTIHVQYIHTHTLHTYIYFRIRHRSAKQQ
mmetsp:Transcript_14447/g.41033  ORF Transcript_14447/g.41033 Transcript_14447/m.41033 type:complete len:116 (-) Transcript_14447:112-459(-)